MPRGNKTGPDGMGPMTGRAMGFCNGFNSSGFTRGVDLGRGAKFGRGGGRGCGRGIGFARVFNMNADYAEQNFNPINSKESIKTEIESVEKYLNELKNMVNEKSGEK